MGRLLAANYTSRLAIGKDVFKKIRKGGDLHRNILVAVEQLVANNPVSCLTGKYSFNSFGIKPLNFQEFYKEHPYNRDALTIWLSMEAATKEKETLPDWLQIILVGSFMLFFTCSLF